ncbi:hypothetical protein [Actinoplanes sichuanensis]|uniref:Uncharacterized protein n=1 Tax=Actinoplanes sichuanensis TaxID=512349 RepID=A0ABW4AGA9_9ACTN|nr:hypothetical protein [Actinoplanes sichuanensis]
MDRGGDLDRHSGFAAGVDGAELGIALGVGDLSAAEFAVAVGFTMAEIDHGRRDRAAVECVKYPDSQHQRDAGVIAGNVSADQFQGEGAGLARFRDGEAGRLRPSGHRSRHRPADDRRAPALLVAHGKPPL